MPKITSKIKHDDDMYIDNKKVMDAKVNELHLLEKSLLQESKNKSKRSENKISPRNRIAELIDKNSEFYELSLLAGHNLYDFPLPAAGIITGVGIINKKACMIICNDYTVKGGTYFPITLKKHLRAQEIALQNKLPCVYIVDSGGAYLPMQCDVFADKEHFGRIFYNQANMSKLSIPQIAIVMGSCTAGGAYVPAMADESIMVRDQATIFLAGPPLVKAATGEIVTADELGGADVHCRESGVADHYAEDDMHAISIARDIISHLPHSETSISDEPMLAPELDSAEINGIINADHRHIYDPKEIIARITDKSEFLEFKEKYGQTLVCGFSKINNTSIGIVANNGVLFSDSSQKACHFIQLCNKRNIPIIFLQNITGFMVGKQHEAHGIAKHGAVLVNAVATATVPKITIMTGGSYGAGNYAMCGRAYSPHFLWAWPNSKTSVMGGEQAANVLAQLKTDKMQYAERWSEAAELEFKNKIKDQYEQESAATYTSSRLMDDGVIDPKDTRKYIIFALALISKESNNSNKGHGIFRM